MSGGRLIASRALLEVLRRHRLVVDRLIRRGTVVVLIVTVVYAIVVRRGDWPAQRFMLVYFAPVLAYGAAWIRQRLARIDQVPPFLLLMDAFAFAAGALRVGGGWGLLPYSGHMLFLSYAVATPGSRALRLIALGLVLMTTWFKLALWHDPRSWTLGLALGLALAGLRTLLAAHVPTPRSQEMP